MTANTKHKKSRNVSGLPELKTYAVKGVTQIDHWSKSNKDGCNTMDKSLPYKRPSRSAHTDSVKIKHYKRIATHIKNKLFNKQSRKKSPILLGTYRRYLSIIRREIKMKVNSNHPKFLSDIQKLCKEYPQYENVVKHLPLLDADTVGGAYKQSLDDLYRKNKDDADEMYNKLKKIEYKHPIMKFLTINDIQYARWNKELANNLSTRKNNQIEFNYHEIMGIIDYCFDQNDFYHLLTGIALATGRRAVEIAYQGDFKKKGQFELTFSGQAKKGVGIETKAYNIPTIVDTDRIMTAFHTLRNSVTYNKIKDDHGDKPEKLRNAAINQKIGRHSNYTAKRLLDPNAKIDASNSTIKSPRQFKDTRAIAVRIALDMIRPERFSTVDENAFIAAYCGHTSYKESSNYQHVKINTDTPESKPTSQINNNEGDPKTTRETVDISALESMDNAIDQTRDRGVIKQHERVKALALTINWKLTQSAIYKGRKVNGEIIKAGGSLPVVKRYLAVKGIAKAIEAFHKANTL